jgi:predicted DsbA family dithiol-disulfide isomerase|uniref:DSBA-like thioredoxin domain-containing protein n=1 Tax=Eutreptiella gymnastica TaxID=73025 RepID=A0A7S4GPI4_9EUGL|mmetsp:Transcript_6423/g.9913  ORF Transcript_6423/g.9913 Transcript_6423/m.9913 type:complete len:264 (+) Transcript_6423:185-976(+)|eukprot:CAMPEP_0174362348 /NCGR_PEP_ID=MMETSP0811_2-20130205/63936_1 /TAXON_ID=73025 ORGANISM="Eutreptiella gymnastica-like, Strain CCMP1594" /NCGR_SAMPLE_ID=MMETSP0811_2 /ASSEMBLY_ACC=CAM_ASM_000667 /LENGTH=263 /DNA_ID=CAMNT_0015499943 /DNA_START=185 /DNA_END=976 /DNA_ORIENTATION=+
MVTALRRFHEQFPDAALQINVTRHPYSFVGDTQVPGREMEGSWHKGLIAYSGGSEARALQAEQGLQMMGAQAGVKFDFSVPVNWQPVDSQRLLLWTGRHGKQEEFMSLMNRKHFEQARSAIDKEELLDCVAAVGLDTEAARAFLNTDELRDVVWQSYGATIRDKNIHSIPLFVFNVPSIGAVGGPFRARAAREPHILNGSMDPDTFLETFTQIYEATKKYTIRETDVPKLSVAQLKEALLIRGVDYRHCVEKEELINLLRTSL